MVGNVSSAQFNLYEGVFWVFLGLVALFTYAQVPRRYRMLCVFIAIVLITFGVSDFVQVLYGSFLQPQMWWLLIWKIVNVIGLVLCVVWYLFLRIAKT